MKFKIGIAAPSFALLLCVGFIGCAQNDDYIPAKRAGFRPPTGPAIPEDLPPVETAAEPPQDSVPPSDISTASHRPPSEPTQAPAPAPSLPPTPAPQPPPEPPKKAAAPEYAKKVPGKPGWIRSPYDNKILDATGIPPGTEVKDPISGKIMLVP
jgi:hypothetical protein